MKPMIERSLRDQFEKHQLFSGLPPETLDSLLVGSSTQLCKPGMAIFHKGDAADTAFFIASGVIRISLVSRNGQAGVLNVLGANEIFGEIALFDPRGRTADAIAITQSVVLAIRRTNLLEAIRSTPDLAMRMLELVAGRLRNATDLQEENMLLSLEQRLARLLLRLGHQTDPTGASISSTQSDLAEMAFTTRESVNRQLSAWSRLAIITTAGRRIRILRPDELERRSSAAPDLPT
jgi:CRP-like cAMP-binding protein